MWLELASDHWVEFCPRFTIRASVASIFSNSIFGKCPQRCFSSCFTNIHLPSFSRRFNIWNWVKTHTVISLHVFRKKIFWNVYISSSSMGKGYNFSSKNSLTFFWMIWDNSFNTSARKPGDGRIFVFHKISIYLNFPKRPSFVQYAWKKLLVDRFAISD